MRVFKKWVIKWLHCSINVTDIYHYNTKKRGLIVLSDTGEAGVEPALTVLETAFLPLEDSPIYMSIRNLLPDSSVVLYAPSKPHILVAE